MEATRIDRLCDKARQAIAERDWDKAKQAYLLALGLKSDAPDIHYGLATVFFHLRELTSAAHHFREVTRLDPARAGAYVNLGAVLNVLGQLDDALAALRKSIQLDPHRVEAFYNLGLVYRRKGQTDLALQAYREALRLNPRMADAHLNVANVYYDKGNYRLSLNHYEEAQKLRPGWDKAEEGVERAREMLESESKHELPAGRPAAPRAPAADSERMIDPNVHHDFLSTLHAATISGEEVGEELRRVVEQEVEPAIKELSTSLLYPDHPRSELEASISRFEHALARMRELHQEMQARVGRLTRFANDHFPGH